MFLLKKKKKKIFILTPLPKKITGGPSHIMPKMSKILRWHKFLAKKWPGGSKTRPGTQFGHISYPPSRILNLDQKQKSYGHLKSVHSQNSKNTFAPPLEVKGRFRQVSPEMKSKCVEMFHFIQKVKFGGKNKRIEKFFNFFLSEKVESPIATRKVR